MSEAIVNQMNTLVVYAILTFVGYCVLTVVIIACILQIREVMQDLKDLSYEGTRLSCVNDELIDQLNDLNKQIEEKEYQFIEMQNKYVSQKRLYETYLNKVMEEKNVTEEDESTDRA